MAQLQNSLVNLAFILITGAVGIVTQKVVDYLNRKSITQILDVKKTSVQIAVQAIEQIARNEQGPNKFNAAKKKALDLLEKQGVNITETELEVLIESCVAEINKRVSF